MLSINVMRGMDGRMLRRLFLKITALLLKIVTIGIHLKQLKKFAAALGEGYIATDAGEYVSPRYDVIDLPKIGAEVSYAFNGDYYPCGKIASISKSFKLITTTEGQKFYRRGESGCWKYNKTWSLVPGHISKLNPEF